MDSSSVRREDPREAQRIWGREKACEASEDQAGRHRVRPRGPEAGAGGDLDAVEAVGRGHSRETRSGADPIQAGENGGWTRGGLGGQRAAVGSGLVQLMAGVSV